MKRLKIIFMMILMMILVYFIPQTTCGNDVVISVEPIKPLSLYNIKDLASIMEECKNTLKTEIEVLASEEIITDEIIPEAAEPVVEEVLEEETIQEPVVEEVIQPTPTPKVYKVVGRSIEYITQEEFDLLVSIVSAEARGEPFEGIVAVVDVILNRVDCSWYPDTITGVVTQKSQFSVYGHGQYKTAPHTEKVINAVLYALENKTIPQDVVYFRSKRYHKWGEPWKQIGNHYFSRY